MAQATAQDIRTALRDLANAEMAEHAQRFFKTGEGQYGCGDRFLGIRVPVLRALVKQHRTMPLAQLGQLLRSEYHEERLFALLGMVEQFSGSDELNRTAIYTLYLKNTRTINNWDLVDCSALYIVGAYLEDKDKQPLYTLAVSKSLWERRIAMIAPFHLIRKNRFEEALAIAEILRDDKEDLIHKAVGWMLREIGKRNLAAEKRFLNKHADKMPRTMLRYAIEKLPEDQRQAYLKKTTDSRRR